MSASASPVSAFTAGPFPVEAPASLNRSPAAAAMRSRPRSRRTVSRALTMATAATIASDEGSAGRAMRLARLQMAVVMLGPSVVVEHAIAEEDAPASSVHMSPFRAPIWPRLGESFVSKARTSRLGEPRPPEEETGLKNPTGTSSEPKRVAPRLGEWVTARVNGSVTPSDGLTRGLELRVFINIGTRPARLADAIFLGSCSSFRALG